MSYRVSFCLLLSIFVICLIQGEDTKSSFLFGTIDNLPPFSYYENNTLVGIDIDVAKELARRCAIDITITTQPWARVLAELKTGDIDGAFSLYYVKERESYCKYIGIIHYDNLGIITKKGREFTYNSVNDFQGKKIGKGSGVFISNEFNEAVHNKLFSVEELDDTGMGNIKKLYFDRLDAVIGVTETMLCYVRQLGYETQITKIEKQIERKRPGYLVFSQKSVFANNIVLQDKIKKNLQDIFLDGTYGNILKKYKSLIFEE